MNWKFTKIHHPARIAIDLTIPEYCVLDIIYQSQTNPTYSIEGWTYAGCHRIAKFLGLSSGTIHAMYDRLYKNGFLEYKDESKNLKRATAKFYDYAYLEEEDIVQNLNVKKGGGVQKLNTVRSKNEHRKRSEIEHHSVQELNTSCSEIEHTGVQKLNDKCSEIEPKLNKLNIELNLTEIERAQTPEISNLESDKLAAQFFCKEYLVLNPDWKNSKYALPYFQNLQKKGEWFLLQLPKDATAKHRWMGQHLSGINQWAARESKFYKTGNANYAQVPPVNGVYRIPKPNYEPEQ